MQWAPTTELTFGTSGGAWIVNFSTTEGKDKNALIAVTSFQFTDYPGGEGAAYLTAAEFNPLLAYVSGGCKGAMAGATPSPSPNIGSAAARRAAATAAAACSPEVRRGLQLSHETQRGLAPFMLRIRRESEARRQ